MHLTKFKAFQICKELWTWMRDKKKSKAEQKNDWPGWLKYRGEGNFIDPDADCPCCEYSGQHDDDYCSNEGSGRHPCLLADTWGSRGDCLDDGSPYASFWDDKGTPADAQKIIDGCDREIRKLKAKRGKRRAKK